jgi:hypothetical protein
LSSEKTINLKAHGFITSAEMLQVRLLKKYLKLKIAETGLDNGIFIFLAKKNEAVT